MSLDSRPALVVLLALGAALAARESGVAWLAGDRSPDSLRRAVGEQQSRWFLPAVNANHLLLLADREADSARRRELLEASTAANPRSAAAWIHLGLEREQAREVAAAERALLEAARLDRQLLPAWTLANFYFRRKDAQNFWTWGARAAALTYDDYRPLLALADRLEPDAARVLARLDAGPELTRTYLDLLIGERRMEAAQQAARALLAFQDPSDRRRILALADRQLAAGRAADAEELRTAAAKYPPDHFPR